MTTPRAADPRPARRVSPWVKGLVAEIARGRHVILHGNVHDMVRWQGGFVSLRTALGEILTALSYELVGRYDQVDGLTFAADDDHRRFAELIGGPAAVEEGQQEAPDEEPADGDPEADPAAAGRRARAAELQRRMRGSLRAGAEAAPRYRQPAEALAAIRRGLAQQTRPVAFVLDFAELLLLDPDHHDRQDRDLLLLTKKMMLESGRAERAQVGNLLILVVPDLASVPPWLHRDEPFVRAVEVDRPSHQERLGYLRSIVTRFHRDPAAPLDDVLPTLANLTDGMTLTELRGLSQTSHVEKVPLSEPKELVKRALFGQQDDPWLRLVDRIPRAEQDLRRRVIGQPDAVRAVSRALAAGTMNIDFVADPHSAEARPKGVFFFAGPTGVGKTELARALSDVIFDDETALTRFDMSTFAEEHSAERLTGAPPGYVGHERGGELTNRVMSRPFSVLLFDEIEKGHVAVFDKFLQILEDGRLTDGLGRTAYFSQSLIIFTSNLGAAPLYERLQQGELPSYQEVSELFQTEVSHHFATTLNRPELLGRIGNGVLAFDLLRPENIPAITAKFLDQLIASAARAGIALDVERESVTEGVRRAMADPRSLALGGREIRNILDRSVRAPLIDRVVESGSRTGHFHVELPEGRAVAVVSRTPDRRIG